MYYNGRTCSISQQYIMKHLEYVTKDHIAMRTILFKLETALFLSNFLGGITALNIIILLLIQSRLSVAKASYSFKHLDTCMPMYTTPTFITKAHCLVTYVQMF